MTKEELLEFVKIRYPNGTNFKCPYSEGKYIVDTSDSTTYDFINGNNIDGGFTKGYLYFQGKWAEIISYPEDNINIFKV
jgi:hypothetical protein